MPARIVALADVYDALVTRRVYKSPWSEEMTLDYIKDQSGKHFDPEVVEAFLAIYDVITAIREKYQEAGLVFSPDCFSLALWPPLRRKNLDSVFRSCSRERYPSPGSGARRLRHNWGCPASGRRHGRISKFGPKLDRDRA